MYSSRTFQVAILLLGATLLIKDVEATSSSCEQMLQTVLTTRQIVTDKPLSNWDKFWQLSSESLKSDRLFEIPALRSCMELYERGDAYDKSRSRSQERLKDIEFKVRLAEDQTKLRRARYEAAQLLNSRT